jgi:hypothetical protein
MGVPAGTTELMRTGPTALRVTVSLPPGWQKVGGAVYESGRGAPGSGLSIGAWRLRHVFVYPCRWASQEFADAQLMRTAEGQAEALSSWWGQDPSLLPYWNSSIAPIARTPRPASFEGYPGWYVEVLIPSGFDLSQCDGGQLILWGGTNGDTRMSVPGELDRLWVVDVNGDPIVIDAASSSVASAADTAAIERVVDSIAIGP